MTRPTSTTLNCDNESRNSSTKSIDSLVFDEEERGPDEQLRLQFEAISHLSPEEKQIVKELPDGMIIKYQSRKWDTTRQAVKG